MSIKTKFLIFGIVWIVGCVGTIIAEYPIQKRRGATVGDFIDLCVLCLIFWPGFFVFGVWTEWEDRSKFWNKRL